MSHRLKAILAGAALAGAGLLPATAAHAEPRPASVLACYDHAHSYSKPSGSFAYPTGAGYLTTTSACSDINLRPNTNRYVRVCFLPDAGGYYCQSSYKLATGGQWNVIATNVANSTDFWFDFRSDAQSSGSWAA
ncbi:hypothetical protein [Kutzneria sp. NPDC052558]|uniref:hypothetical protein n=1 Tax=Kutzneria sp. NPDC052558 TaxID=3364121 RepID=UPI0037C5D59C